MLKRLFLFIGILLCSVGAHAGPVSQSGSVTPNTATIWNSDGVVKGGVTATDSPLTSFGVTRDGVNGICVSSGRQTAAGRNQLCFQVSTAGAAQINLQNYGTAAAQSLQFVINGTTYAFPGSLSQITVNTTPVVGGSNGQCLFVSAGTVGQQACTLSAITSLTGDATATGPGVAALTLATVNGTPGSFGSGALVPVITVNGKGLVTTVSQVALALTVNSTTIGSGSTNGLLYNNGGVLGNLGTIASGVLVTSAGSIPSISTTLPPALSIGSPTFTGTITAPDAATWSNLGLSKAAALSVGNATLPSGGNVSISGQYQINGTQIAASNLSNGTTGSGAVVLAASPALSGTVTGSFTASGNLTLSGNDTFSAQAIHTGTSAPASAAGNSVVMGTIAAPTLTNNGQAFLFNTTVNGAVVEGAGSTYDVALLNKSGSVAIGVGTGTTVPVMPGLASGTCSSGLGLDAGNNVVKVSCPGAAASIQIGTTGINSAGATNRMLTEGTVSGAVGTLAETPVTADSSGNLAAVNSIAGSVIASKAQQQTGSAAVNVVTPSQQQSHDSAVKAFAQFTNPKSNIPATINIGYNITSVTRTATGTFTVVVTTAFASATNYGCVISANSGAGANTWGQVNTYTNATTFTMAYLNASASLADPDGGTIMCMGRQ